MAERPRDPILEFAYGWVDTQAAMGVVGALRRLCDPGDREATEVLRWIERERARRVARNGRRERGR